MQEEDGMARSKHTQEQHDSQPRGEEKKARVFQKRKRKKKRGNLRF